MEICEQHVLTALDFRDTKLVVEHTVKEKENGSWQTCSLWMRMVLLNHYGKYDVKLLSFIKYVLQDKV